MNRLSKLSNLMLKAFAVAAAAFAVIVMAAGGVSAQHTVTLDAQGGTSPMILFAETFENGGNSDNGWDISNYSQQYGSQKNEWVIGRATRNAGSYSAYISNDNGSTNQYSLLSASIVHLYKRISFPNSDSDFIMKFYFRGNTMGNASGDYLRCTFNVGPTPPAGAAEYDMNNLYFIVSGSSSWTQRTVSLPAADFRNRDKTLIFTWNNNPSGSGGSQPPPAIDDISITYSSATVYAETGAGGTLASLPAPTRTNYVFNGWYTAAEGGEEVTTSTVFDAAATVYAQWLYTITFNANRGTVTPASGAVGADGTLASLPTPTRTGYTFDGWYTAAEGGVQVTTGTVFDANTTVYAQWLYTITFNANRGTVTPASGAVGADGTLASLPTPTRTGYTFNGWYTASTGGTLVTDDRVYSAPATIYAQWAPVTYTITYGLDGGSVSSANLESYTVETTAFTLRSPTKTGYTFAGWTGTNGAVPQTAVSIASGSTGDRTYTANWTLITYTVTFNVNGGTSPYDTVLTESFEDGAPDWVLANGGQTNKWVIGSATRRLGSYSAYISSTGGESNFYIQASASTVYLYKDVTFPASNSNFILTFYFKGNGESGYDYMTVNYSATSSTPAGGTVLGTNYYSNSSWTQKTITLPVETFSGKTMRLIFTWRNDNRDGTQPPAAIDDICISHDALADKTGAGGTLASLPTPTRAGYAFKGWYTAATGGTLVTVDRVYSASTTVYAQWTPVAVTDITGVPETVEAGKAYTLAGTVVPEDAPNRTIVWTVATPGSTGAVISGNILSTSAAGDIVVKARITNGTAAGEDYEQTFTITITNTTSIASSDRVAPAVKPSEEATVIAPMVILSGEFTAGPNPVAKSLGNVNFYRQGKRVANSELRIYDATGNVISKVKISDKAIGNQSRRIVGKWDLTDKKGRQVSEGTYLVKGVLKTSDGNSEKVSVILGVR